MARGLALNSAARIYFSRDYEGLHDLPESIQQAWRKHWDGDFVGALDAYKNLQDVKDKALLALAQADCTWLEVKQGHAFREKSSHGAVVTRDARVILEIARYMWAFWVDHRIAWRSLFKLLLLSPFVKCRGMFLWVAFNIGHMLAIRGNRWIGAAIAIPTYKLTVALLKTRLSPDAYLADTILACCPYTYFVSGRLGQGLAKSLKLGERCLSNDGFYLSLFYVTAIYAYGFGGDVTQTEVYAARLRQVQQKGNLLRYVPVARIMTLLPFALRGYSFLVSDEFERLYRSHDRHKSDPLINSQFYRAASVIALFLRQRNIAIEATEMAIAERKKTRSFQSWATFDRRLQDLATREKPFNPSSDRLLFLPTLEQQPINLGSLLVRLMQVLQRSVGKPQTETIDAVAHALCGHLGLSDFTLSTSIPSFGSDEQFIKIFDYFVSFPGLEVNRKRYVKQELSALAPIILLITETHRLYAKEEEFERASALADLSLHVAHDVRAPMAAFEAATKDLSGIQEGRRILLRNALARMRDITQGLLAKGREYNAVAKKTQDDVSQVSDVLAVATSLHISLVVDAIVSEKRLQYRELYDVQILAQIGMTAYGLFSVASRVEIGRALSNLIDNAVEAVDGNGNVEVLVHNETEFVLIEIKDNGSGIPEDIQPLLMKVGASFGKAEGNGLGLLHAKEFAESCGGNLTINSTEGAGTIVALRLPKSTPPKWFVDTLQIKDHERIVVLDDDPLIHQIWDDRFDQTDMLSERPIIHHFSKVDQLRDWKTFGEVPIEHTIFLVDYELYGSECSGLEAIQELHIESRAIVVTSRFDDLDVVNSCSNAGVRIIPKSMAGLVPISFGYAVPIRDEGATQ